MTRAAEPAILTRRAPVAAPTTINVDARTVEVVWTTGARVLRRTFDGPFWEELSLDPKHVRLARLNSGAPFLNSHNAYDLGSAIGVIERAVVDGTNGVATVRFAKATDDPDADRIFRKVRDGILRSVSVGYRVHKWQQLPPGADGIPIRRAVDWEPVEISVVAVPADAGAAFRSMKETPVDPEEVETEPAVGQERERARTIREIGRRAHLGAEAIDRLIDSGATVEVVRAEILDHLAVRDALSGTRGVNGDGSYGRVDSADDFRAAAVDGQLLRAGVQVRDPHPAAIDFRNLTAVAMASTCLARAGISLPRGTSDGEVARRAMTTSDFPIILGDLGNKATRQGYESQNFSHTWVRRAPVRDFKEVSRPLLGSAPSLAVVGEAGEYGYGYFQENGTTYRVRKHGKIVAVSWETIVNDNLGAFTRMMPSIGIAARRAEADEVYALFAENSGAGPAMADSVNLFDVTHGNVTSAGAVNASTLGAGRALMRKQRAQAATASGGSDYTGGYLNPTPRVLLVAPDQETAAEILLASATRHITSTSEASTPEWLASLQLAVEPRLTGDAMYLIADHGDVDSVELGLLEENYAGGPKLGEEEAFNKDEKRWKVRHVFAAKALDWRGIVKMPIAEPEE